MKKQKQQREEPCPHKSVCPAKNCGDCPGEEVDAIKQYIQNSVRIDRITKVLSNHEGEVLTEELINKIEAEIRG